MSFPNVRQSIGLITIPEMFERSCTLYKEQIAIMTKEGDEWISLPYKFLYEKVTLLAKYLKDEIGLKKGNKVAIIGQNSPYWVISYFACHWLGLIVIPVDTRLKTPEIKFILKDSESVVIIAQDTFLEELLKIQRELPTLKHIISKQPNKLNITSLQDIFQKVKTGIPMEKVFLEDYAVILYTSGTTGISKGVLLSHKNIISDVDAVYQTIEYGPNDRFFSVLPLHHVYEQTCGLICPIAGGATIAYASSLKSKVLIEEMRYVKPTVMLTVPLLLEKIVEGIIRKVKESGILKKLIFNSLRITARNLDKLFKGKISKTLFRNVRAQLGMENLRYLISGGAALPRWVSFALEEMGFPILQGYGLSETSPVITLNPPFCPRNESVGLPLPYVEIKIHEPDNNGIGEIAIKGPMVMVGYYQNEEATKEVFTEDGWFLTGDMGYMDKDGYLYITGRKKSVIITSGGKNIYPEEVEIALLRSPYISEVLVIGVWDSDKNKEDVHAIVYPNFENVNQYFEKRGIKNPNTNDLHELIHREIVTYSSDLANYKRVRKFTIREEEFPKTTSMKIKRYLFQQQKIK
ncbi:Long-chain-fatty-acid--CoA ligase [Thermodesulfovibrio sp. N1]|uniref:AMP-dependent synthetase/ligase n=1 Tax=unclassified Thermodesulfovibrio TaxID=2645936 RepID=UPI00083AC5EB|nr:MULTISPECIES: AMP-dependent synthetase/ligase [unclassified Thermodesulfovibrio]MDI1472570.1 AMP-dependent synthetase/ligase [Thermodesulfovibrio sp. 1176]ODA44907.1 Long-chain-fatty-acid--CoA ligase [Thermodesulfovibrio sp. N1]